MAQADTLNLFIMLLGAIIGFGVGLIFGVDQGHKHVRSKLKVAEATAHELRIMALNLAEVSKHQNTIIKELRSRVPSHDVKNSS